MHLEREEIFPYLKNRPPLFMLGSIDIVPGESAVSKKFLTNEEWYFSCHFPGNPMMPGVLQLETLFQTAIMCVKVLPGMAQKLSNITRIKDVSFFSNIRPESEITVITRLVRKYRHGIAEAEGEILCNGETCCKASFVITIPEDMSFVKRG